MKCHIITLIFMLLALPIPISASTIGYTPLVREGVEWEYASCSRFIFTKYTGEQDIMFHCGRFKVQFRGDTIINNLRYKKAYQYYCDTLDTSTTPAVAFLREENGRVYRLISDECYEIRYKNPYLYDYQTPKYANRKDEQLIFEIKRDSIKFIDNSLPFLISDSVIIDNQVRYVYSDGLPQTSDFIEGMGFAPHYEACLTYDWGSILFPYKSPPPAVNPGWRQAGILYERNVDGDTLFDSAFVDVYNQIDSMVNMGVKGEYQPLVREGVEWGNLTFDYQLKNFRPYRLQFKGDSIINDVTYKKLYAYDSNILDVHTTPIYALMREEGKKIYLYKPKEYDTSPFRIKNDLIPCSETEYLVYDFGDSDFWLTFSTSIDVNQYPQYGPITIGVGYTGNREMGNMAYPFCNINYRNPNYDEKYAFLYLRDVETGRIIFQNDCDDWMLAKDPTYSSIDAVISDSRELSVEHLGGGKMLIRGAQDGALIEAFDAQGRKVATSHTATITLPTPGLYIIRAGSHTAKIKY